MWSTNARELVKQVSSAVVFVEVKDNAGSLSMGTAFHVGGGFFATARHVIEGNAIMSVGRRDTSLQTHVTDSGQVVRTTTYPDFKHAVVEKTYNHPNTEVDFSLIKLAGIVGRIPAEELVPILQLYPQADVLTEGEFLMQEVMVLGYPPIPCSMDSHLVVFRGEVSAVIENYHDRKRHFIISGMARGGFSGGPVVLASNPNTVLGIVGKSLIKNTDATELGFIGAVSSSAAFETIDHHSLNIRAIQMTLKGFILPQNGA